ncbi:MAG: hypothetical protein WD942_07595 [Dehalococcoidia bacterium]
MYQIIGVKRALTVFGLLCAATIILWVTLAPPAQPYMWWRIASGSVTLVALVVGLVGQTAIFPWLCRLPLVRSWFPPFDGEWIASLESNWPAIQQRSRPGGPPVTLQAVKANVTIIARLFHIRMNLASDDRYSTSKTVFVRATRDPQDGSVSLHYLYHNTTKKAKETDSDSHDGAANLTVEGQGKDIWIEGVYWTNRNWHLGLNTAGKITLRKR